MLSPLCEKCKLYQSCQSPFMGGSGSEQPKILFCGEGPGKLEDEQGIPFVGRSGQLLRKVIKEVLDLAPDEYRFTNVVRCRPPDNRNPKANEIKYCLDNLVKEIEETQPKVVILLGNIPLKAVLGQSGISHWNGQVVERDGIFYVPAYHPSYLLRNGLRPDLLTEWGQAFSKALDVLEGKKLVRGDAHYEYLFPKTIKELRAMADELLSNDELVAYDIESAHKNEMESGNKVLTVALANDKKAWSFPIDHQEATWSTEEREQVLAILAEVLQGCKIIGQLVKFDCKLTARLLGIEFIPYGDVIHLSRLVNAHHLEHGLKRNAGLFLQMFDYDKELQDYINEHPECNPAKEGSYANIPLSILLPYGGMDGSATWLLHKILFEQLTPKQRVLYQEMIIAADYALGRIESFGFQLDLNLVKRYEAIYTIVKDALYTKLIDNPQVKAYCKKRQAELNEKGGKPKTFIFNPNSSLQMRDILYDRMKLPVYEYTKTGKASVGKPTLEKLLYDLETV